MASPRRIIIDTDPGVDDILAMLLAFAAKPEELEVLMISLTFGNIDVQSCLRNAVSLFHHIEKEWEWRRSNGKPEGFDTLEKTKPIIAIGAEEPLADQRLMADYFHGKDGLGGIHDTHPHLTPQETWRDLFKSIIAAGTPEEAQTAQEIQDSRSLFAPSRLPAHKEMLRVLRANEPDTISIVALGPLTNLALAAAEDPETFLRVKEVVVMGGAFGLPGNVITFPQHPSPTRSLKQTRESLHDIHVPPFNLIKQPDTLLRRSLNSRNQITPTAEFNTYADSIASARVFALTSPRPDTTMPPVPPAPPGKVAEDPPPPHLSPYPIGLRKTLRVVLVPLDVTDMHVLTRKQYDATIKPLLEAGSPLAEWTNAFLSATFHKMETLHTSAVGDAVGLSMHDPLCIWYVLTHPTSKWHFSPASPEDIRIETSGQWTRGMCVIDRRDRRKRPDDGEGGEIPSDTGNWLSSTAGNRIWRVMKSPGEQEFIDGWLARVFS